MKSWESWLELVRVRQSGHPGCHDFEHTLRVIANAERLLDEYPAADAEVVRFGALLHDIARPEEMASGGKLCHAEAGAPVAYELLRAHGVRESLAQAVSRCVARHRYRGGAAPETLEERIVYDADKLDSLGAVGVGRAFLFAGRCHAKVHNRMQEALAGAAYGEEDTAYREYLVKLRGLPERLLTEAGRLQALDRAEFMRGFFEELHREVYQMALEIPE